MQFLNAILLWLLCITSSHAISQGMQQVATATTGTRIIYDTQPQWNVKFIPANLTAHMDTVTLIVVELSSKFIIKQPEL